eukprot:CAMPEP_0198596308 /NCGR_PEP_ID=MMETSP1462-20131121/142993_1 /TAXON_ID=1333877 /ORGANISM="Brandtodinium nutriculum, Strain RCC3387" /LENGTH=133 /DNA_ID=CAMNT_0044327945 /DNA_START=45 /DNA_END=442 /DNA_ORIENTATION=-
MEAMRAHRLLSDQIRQQRRDEEERQKAALVAEPQDSARGATTAEAEAHSKAPRELGRGSMFQRCAVLDEHVAANGAVMGRHREFLDEVHAMRRAQAEAAGQTYDPLLGARGGIGPADGPHSRSVQEQAAWMGP